MDNWRHALIKVILVEVIVSLLYFCILYFLFLEVSVLKILSHLKESGNW